MKNWRWINMVDEKKIKTARLSTTMKQKKFIDAFIKSACNITKACEVSGIPRRTYYGWIKKGVKFKQDCLDAWENRKDFVENKIMQHIKDGNVTMAIFFAKTQMKDRGYVERTEMHVDGKLEHGHDVLISAFKKREEEIEKHVRGQIPMPLVDIEQPKGSTGLNEPIDTDTKEEKETVIIKPESSNINSLEYYYLTKKLKVWFKSSPDTYYEYGCDEKTFAALNAAKSKGKFINHFFKHKNFKKVEVKRLMR